MYAGVMSSGSPSGVQVLEGQLNATGLKFGIVVSRFNEVVTDRLLDSAVNTLTRSGARSEDIYVARVPGAWELPIAAAAMAKGGKLDAVIALGCLIKGDTAHFDLIAAQCASKLASLAVDLDTPMMFGVLTTNTLEQAVDRSGAKLGNKGGEVAAAAIEQVQVLREIEQALGGGN